jgi:uncharacterized membrane protein (UPF0127 family)
MEFDVQIPESGYKGLSGKKVVEKPMLFVFSEPEIRSMCMRGMKVPLDIVWADKDGKITKVYQNIQANDRGLFSSVTPAKYAVECAAGDATRLGLKAGKRIRIFGHPPNVD